MSTPDSPMTKSPVDVSVPLNSPSILSRRSKLSSPFIFTAAPMVVSGVSPWMLLFPLGCDRSLNGCCPLLDGTGDASLLYPSEGGLGAFLRFGGGGGRPDIVLFAKWSL